MASYNGHYIWEVKKLAFLEPHKPVIAKKTCVW